MNIKISVVIPARNGEQFLAETIRSTLAQTRQADEIIVVDDDSTDRTATIAQSGEWCGKVGYHFNSTSTGFVDAWNRAIARASSDFVTILHQDDLLHPEYLEHIEEALQQYPSVRHMYTACTYIDENGTLIKGSLGPLSPGPVLYSGNEYAHNYLNSVVTNNHIHRCPGVTTARSLLLRDCTYRKEAGHIADDDFFLRVGKFTDVVGISKPLASYRQHRESATGKLESLTLHLARDYVFQAEFYSEGSPVLDKNDINKINGQAVRFINLLLFQSLRHGNTIWRREAFRLRERLDSLLPGFIQETLPSWGRLLWKLTLPEGGNSLARSYAFSLAAAISARDALKKMLD